MKRHYGKILGSNNTVIVAFMSIPNDPEHCLIINPSKLDAQVRAELFDIVNSDQAQRSVNIHDILHRSGHPDGGSMLDQFHAKRQLERFSTDQVVMIPDNGSEILLKELNSLIAKVNMGLENVSDEQLEEARNIQKVQNDAHQEEDNQKKYRILMSEAADLEEQAKLLVREAEKKRERANTFAPQKPAPKAKPKAKKVENSNEKT